MLKSGEFAKKEKKPPGPIMEGLPPESRAIFHIVAARSSVASGPRGLDGTDLAIVFSTGPSSAIDVDGNVPELLERNSWTTEVKAATCSSRDFTYSLSQTFCLRK